MDDRVDDVVLVIVMIVGAVVVAFWHAYWREDHTRILRGVAAQRGGSMRGDVLHLRIEDADVAISVDDSSLNAEVGGDEPLYIAVVRRRAITARDVEALIERVAEARRPRV